MMIPLLQTAILLWQASVDATDLARSLVGIIAGLAALIGLGTLAGGIGIFKAGWALGRNSSRITHAFENYVAQSMDRHEQITTIAQRGIDLAQKIHADQNEIHKTLSAIRTGLSGLWSEIETIPKGERRGGN